MSGKELSSMNYKFIMEGLPIPETVLNGKKYLYFGGVGYYQLHSHPEVVQAAIQATMRYGLGSATSTSIAGMTPVHLELEQRAATYFDTEDAILLPSGYLSSFAGLQALSSLYQIDRLFLDESSHYCNRDAAALLGKPVVNYRNNDPDHLRQAISRYLHAGEKPLVVTDGVFPVYGVVASIPDLLTVALEFDGVLWIDDAHGCGLLGQKGRGVCEYHGIQSDRIYQGTTFSKAMGGFGGVVAGSREFVSTIRSGYLAKGSTKPTPAAVAASSKGMEILSKQPELRHKLHRNARELKQSLGALGISVEDNELPIVAFSLESIDRMKQVHSHLLEKGIFIQYTDYAGSAGGGVLRIVVFSGHTHEQIHYLVDSLKECLI